MFANAFRTPVSRFASLLFLSAGLVLTPSAEGASAGFENTGSLAQARRHHTATLLPNGQVLVSGGEIDGALSTVGSAELYDVASRTWTATGSLNKNRADHTATLLPDGKVLVAGGRSFDDNLTSAELYDPASGTWTPTGNLNVKRRAHTATLLPNGKVLVTGGLQETGRFGSGFLSLTSAELYDPATGVWTITGSLATARGDHTATLLSNGKVLVVGGRPGFSGLGNPPITSAELYDSASGTWTSTGSLHTGRWNHTATLLPNGEVLAAAGFGDGMVLLSAEVYDPATATWRSTGNLSNRRALHTATLLPDNKVLVVGGFGSDFPAAHRSVELYEPASGNWTPTGSLVTRRDLHTAILLPDGTVLVAAGVDRDQTANGPTYLASAELYVESTPTLLNISTRAQVLTDDKVLIGGFIITGTETKTVIVRGIGPSLPVPGALANPVIEVHGASGQLLATNDNWQDAATKQEISDSGLAPSNELESALWGTINPGAYTVVLTGKDGGTGVGMVEVYDLDHAADSRLANISSRGFVDTGDNVIIGGLIIGSGSPFGSANVVVRALGPSIPVNGALANPTVELHDENGAVIAFNDDWETRSDGSSQQAEIEATTVPPSNHLESALVRRLSPGDYTVIVRGQNGTTGIGSVEVYHLP